MQREVAIAGAGHGTRDVAIGSKHQRKRIFGNGVGRIGWYAYHADAHFGSCLQIDVVITCTTQGNQLYAMVGHCTDDVCIHRVVDEDADSCRALGK